MFTIVMATDITDSYRRDGKEPLRRDRMGSFYLLSGRRCEDVLRSGVAYDFGERLWIEAGAAYERAIDVRQSAEGTRIVGLDGAAVEDAGGGG